MSRTASDIATTQLELSDRVISSAIKAFIMYKVNRLSKIKGFDGDLQKHIYTVLSSKAGDTFLWVALVCLELEGLGVQPRHVAAILETMPKGLDGLYQRMLAGALDSVCLQRQGYESNPKKAGCSVPEHSDRSPLFFIE